MPSDKPLRLRRLPIGKADPPQGTVIGSTTISTLDPVHSAEAGHRGFPDNTSNSAAEGSHGEYKDEASQPKRESPRVNEPVPFANLRAGK